MIKFEQGKRYRVNGGGVVTIERRTPCYVTVSGAFCGRYRVGAFGDKGLFGLGESFSIRLPFGLGLFCFAAHEEEVKNND